MIARFAGFDVPDSDQNGRFPADRGSYQQPWMVTHPGRLNRRRAPPGAPGLRAIGRGARSRTPNGR